MTKAPKLLAKAIARNNNLRFVELTALAEAFGFELDRISGSHHIYVHRGAGAVLNLQPVDGKAKPYQVRQLLSIIERYNLELGAPK